MANPDLPLATTESCTGEAHRQPYIDHCGQCAPNWGFVVRCSACGAKLRYNRKGVLQMTCETCGMRHQRADYKKLYSGMPNEQELERQRLAYEAQLAAIAASDDAPWATRQEVERWTDDIAKWSNPGLREAVISALVEAVNNTIEQCANLAHAEGQDKLAEFMREGLIK